MRILSNKSKVVNLHHNFKNFYRVKRALIGCSAVLHVPCKHGYDMLFTKPMLSLSPSEKLDGSHLDPAQDRRQPLPRTSEKMTAYSVRALLRS